MMRRMVGAVVVLLISFVGLQASAQHTPLDFTKDCTAAGCHDQYAKRRFQHGPVASDACDACHEQTNEKKHGFKLRIEGGKLCEDCHVAHPGKVRHEPAAQGQCTACHDPHAAETEHLLTAATLGELCFECHDDFGESLKFLHGPTAAGACTACHDAHASDHANLLKTEGTPICTTCHQAMQASFANKEYRHAPVVDDCIACHNPHGADNRMNLTSEAPGLCTECHDAIADILSEATVKHDAVTAGRACVDCHDPHASNVEHILAKEPMDLCLSCHDRELKSGDGKIIAIGPLLKENTEHHGPIRHKNCTTCHNEIHGGSRFRLLSGEYPTGFYAPFEEARYAFCFECHEADLVRGRQTDKLTNFRNGDQNLHYIHVNREVKGRTCRACHDTHASKKPRHLTESVPFGAWQLPVGYEKTDTGGSCRSGCHKVYRYDRNKPVVNIAQ